MASKFPKMSLNQHGVALAEKESGLVLDINGNTFLGSTELYKIMETFEEAKKYALQTAKQNRHLECWIINSKGVTIGTCDSNGYKDVSLLDVEDDD